MKNLTENEIIVENELARRLYIYGQSMGKQIQGLLEEGKLEPNSTVRLLINAEAIENMKSSNFPLGTKLLITLGTPQAIAIGNGAIVCTGLYTGTKSAFNLVQTENRAAKLFYLASIGFSTSAVGNCTVATLARACELSNVGVCSEAFGYAFMRLGDLAYYSALRIEGKPIPANLQYLNRGVQQPRRLPLYHNQNLGFVMPGTGFSDFAFLSETIKHIPFQKIGQVVGFSLTVYSYSKIVIVGYQYSQKLIAKYKEKRKKQHLKRKTKLLRKQAYFLALYFSKLPSIHKKLLIYRLVTKI